jgi:hypothetical protein
MHLAFNVRPLFSLLCGNSSVCRRTANVLPLLTQEALPFWRTSSFIVPRQKSLFLFPLKIEELVFRETKSEINLMGGRQRSGLGAIRDLVVDLFRFRE